MWDDGAGEQISPNDVLKNKKYKNHYDRIMNADLDYPILVSKNNDRNFDGLHRYAKAIYLKKKTYIDVMYVVCM